MKRPLEVDDLVNRFRLASREVRNHWFHPPDWDQPECEVIEGFDEIERLLFENLVLRPADLQHIDYGRPNPSIVVAPRTPAPIMINRDRGAESGYWDHPVKTVDSAATLIFVKFFDWDQLAYRDNRYVHVLISDHRSLADLVGRHALLETQYVRYTKAGAAAV